MTKLLIKSSNAKEIEPLLRAAIEKERNLIELGISKTKDAIRNLEKKHRMKTFVFYRKFQAGKIGDQFDYIRWAGEYETLKRLEKEIRQLRGVVICT